MATIVLSGTTTTIETTLDQTQAHAALRMHSGSPSLVTVPTADGDALVNPRHVAAITE
jgi:hypothetical protein